MLDSPGGVCAGQRGSEYPATSVPFSNARIRRSYSTLRVEVMCSHRVQLCGLRQR
jgi:hypothetical protein